MKHRAISWGSRVCIGALCCAAVAGAAAAPTSRGGDLPDAANLSWLFPLNPPSEGEHVIDAKTPLRLPGSSRAFTEAQLTDRFFAPDWYPESHTPMPDIVRRGRAPGVYACGYCHLPAGEGRPENAALAGLPAAYIVQQVADMKSGARRSAWHGGPFLPVDLMRDLAANAEAADVAAAADYFAAQTLRPRVTVRERERIPRLRVMGWLYVIDSRGGQEALGERLLEWAPDGERHERRDPLMRYVAFVPPGSVRRGREIATTEQRGAAQPCIGCHGEHLRGIGLIPALAGRSPTYLLRQLVAFKTGDRAGPAAASMQAVAAPLGIADMIAVAAYAAAQ
jgi:cytochrome c553